MKQEDKDLLLKELCSRLPYGVKVNAPFTSNKNENAKGYKITSISFGVVEYTPILFGEKKQRNSIIIEAFSEKYNQYCSIDLELDNNIERVKSYLFPLSSMTEKQKKECPVELSIINAFIDGHIYLSEDEKLTVDEIINMFDWFNKNHFDYRGLIEKGLAIDATNLNIY